MRWLLALAIATSLAAQTLELIDTIRIEGDTHHVQGIEVDGDRLWLTSVDVRGKRGLLLEYSYPARKLLRSVEIHSGDRYHPGGISADGESLWIPVAEYKRSSSALVQKRSKRTLALESQFEVKDHIGAIAVTPEGLLGANWDAQTFYVWDKQGKLIRSIDNPYDGRYQDMKFAREVLIAGGLLADRSGVVDLLALPDLQRVRRIKAANTARGVAYTHEGLALSGDKILLLPEDAPSSLYVFRVVQ